MQRNENLNTNLNTPKKSSFNTSDMSDHKEGFITKQIEKQTAKIPSGVYLSLAIGSMATSFALALIQGKSKGWANFIGQWAPTFLILGLYNKLVKVEGHEGTKSAFH